MSPLQQRPFASNLCLHPPADLQILSDGSVRSGIEDGGAGLEILSQNDFIHAWYDPTDTHGSSFLAEKAALKDAIQCISSISSWATATVICVCKSLVHGVSNANSADSYVLQQQTAAAAAALVMSRSKMIMWAFRHCGQSGNELANHQAKLGAAETQLDNALEPVTRRALIRRSCRPSPIQHERLSEV